MPESAEARAWGLLRADLPPAERRQWEAAAAWADPSQGNWSIFVDARDGSRWRITSAWVGMLTLEAIPPQGWTAHSRPAREAWEQGLRLCAHLTDQHAVLPHGDQVVGLRRLLQACPEVVYDAANIVASAFHHGRIHGQIDWQ